MRNQPKKYKIVNLGAFTTLDHKDFNDLCSLELNFLHVPCVFYIKEGYSYTGNELLVSDKELKTKLKLTTGDLLN
jgi:hypothetical protein